MKLSVKLFQCGLNGRTVLSYGWRIYYGRQIIDCARGFQSVKEARENLGQIVLELRKDDFEVYDLTEKLVVKVCEPKRKRSSKPKRPKRS